MAPRDYTTMAYWSLGGLVALTLLVAWNMRHRISPHLPSRLRQLHPYTLLPTSNNQEGGQGGGMSFGRARMAGLTSRLFDVEENLASADQRALDAGEVQRIMQELGVGFDEARLIRQKRYMARNGVDSTGMPTDKKAVTSLS